MTIFAGSIGLSPDTFAQDSDSKKKVLVLGDSISIGYTPYLSEQLADVAVVTRPMASAEKAENCAGTKNGVANIDRWIEQAGNPDVITFNFGLHDFKRETRDEKPAASKNPADPPQSDPETYRRNLTEIVERLQKTGAKLFFVTTTPVPPGGVSPHRDIGDPLLYNGIARQVVEPRGIEVIDLFVVAAAKPEWMRSVNVHFTEEGSKGLAEAIAKPVRAALKDLEKAKQGQVAPEEAEPWRADPEVVERLSRSRPYNYQEAQVPEYELPDPLAAEDGSQVSKDQWPGQRARTLQLLRDHVYGRVPAAAAKATLAYTPGEEFANHHLVGRKIEATIALGEDEFSFPFLVYLPKDAEGPVPAVVMIHNRGFPELAGAIQQPSPFIPVEPIVKRGYAVAVFHTSHVDPDRKDGFQDGIRGFFHRNRGASAEDGQRAGDDQADANDPRGPEDWGALRAWAWGAGRVLDYLEQLPQVDSSRVAVIGHSRGGKTAALAAATDERFAVAMVNQSGCGGAALSRRRFGETIGRITSSFPHWFCKRLSEYADREDELPVDQHQLMGLIAPRAVVVGSASHDLWADPKGEYLSLVHAAPVFELLGREAVTDPEMPPPAQPRFVGATGYTVRPGSHGLHEGDWMNYLDFLDGEFSRNGSESGD